MPTDLLGDVMGDLNSSRGKVQGTEQGDGGEQVIYALVPESELLRYAIDLRSLTGGRGRFAVATTTTTCCRRTSSTRSARTCRRARLMAQRRSPSDAVVALRSMGRRCVALPGLDEDESADALAAAPAADGRSALDHATPATRTVSVLDGPLEQVVVDDDAVARPAVADHEARAEWPGLHAGCRRHAIDRAGLRGRDGWPIAPESGGGRRLEAPRPEAVRSTRSGCSGTRSTQR